AIDVSGAPLKSAVVGVGAQAVAFARVWLVDAQKTRVDINRIVGARVANSYGLIVAPRRAGFDIVERRQTQATIEREGDSFLVGPHWPRLVEDGTSVVYVADGGAAGDEGLEVNSRDLTEA